MRRRVLLVAAVMITGAACTATPTPVPSPPTTPAATPSPSPSGTPEPATDVPLALVVHATRPVADVPLTAARRALAGDVDRWSQLDQTGGAVTVLGPDTDPAAALRRVRADDAVLAVLRADRVDPTVRVLTVAGRHPLRDPGRYPLTVPVAGAAPPTVTTLAAVGDVMLGRRVGRAVGDDPGQVFDPFRSRLRGADVTVGNLESTLSTDGSPTQGGDSFAADPDVVPALRAAGFDLVSLANNHVGDYGARALRQTLDGYAAGDLPTVGAGRDLDQARRSVIITRDGVRIGFLATDSIGETPAATDDRAGTNRLDMPPRTGPFDEDDLERITGDIADLAARVDLTVVIPHWGTQYTHRPEDSQRRAARAFADAGADLILGGHPHWVQGWETRGDAVIVHSLGNFVFDMDFQVKTREGIAVEAVLWDGELKAVEPVPYVIGDDFVPRPVSGERAAGILADVWSTGRGPYAVPD